MKTILLTRGKKAIVDDSDHNALMQYKWHASPRCKGWIASRSENGRTIQMHRQILGFPKTEIDHKNVDGLDNRRENLRPCTRSQNLANRRLFINNTSGYKGVSFHKGHGKWNARIKINYKCINLGFFEDKLLAALAYRQAAVNHFGEFSRHDHHPC